MSRPRPIKTTTKDTSLNRIQISFSDEDRLLIGKAASKEGKGIAPWARDQLVRIARGNKYDCQQKAN